MTIGDQIKQLRTAHNLTQQEFAEKVYISYQSVSNWERQRGHPTTAMMLTIIETFDLPLNFFMSQTTNPQNISEEALIFSAFYKAMSRCREEAPDIEIIQQISGLSTQRIQKLFPSYDDLVYAFINNIDQDIKIKVEERLSSNHSAISVFINDMAPLLYSKKEFLHILYTRPYIKNIWMQFIRSKYRSVLIKYLPDTAQNTLDTAYLTETLMTFISVWMSQPTPEPLATFQKRMASLSELMDMDQS